MVSVRNPFVLPKGASSVKGPVKQPVANEAIDVSGRLQIAFFWGTSFLSCAGFCVECQCVVTKKFDKVDVYNNFVGVGSGSGVC